MEDWFCDESLMSAQECLNMRDELERYLSQRVLIFHHEEHCNHLDHFEQVSAYMALNGLSLQAERLGADITFSHEKEVMVASVGEKMLISTQKD